MRDADRAPGETGRRRKEAGHGAGWLAAEARWMQDGSMVRSADWLRLNREDPEEGGDRVELVAAARRDKGEDF